MITVQPALVSTSAAVAPAGPVPTITALASVTAAHFVVGEAAGLGITAEFDGAPAHKIAIAAVLGRAVRAFARVLVEKIAELSLRAEPLELLGLVDVAEVGAERGNAVAIDLLPATHRAVEFALGFTERAFDARSPRKLFVRRERHEACERRFAAIAPAERSARIDARRIDAERAERAVDVIGDTEGAAARVRVDWGNEDVGARVNDCALMFSEKAAHDSSLWRIRR